MLLIHGSFDLRFILSFIHWGKNFICFVFFYRLGVSSIVASFILYIALSAWVARKSFSVSLPVVVRCVW